MIRAAAVIALTLATASVAAATTPIRWQPAKMAAALTALKYGHAGILGGSCAGLGLRRSAGYARFRCRMTWQTSGPPLASGKVTVWARPLAKGRVCASTRSVAACQPLAAGPVAGDPRVCSYTSSQLQCATDAARNAVRKQVGDGQITCEATSAMTASPITFRCTRLGDASPYVVTFTRGTSAWSVSVKPG